MTPGWAIDDSVAKALIPGGWIHDYVSYQEASGDAPLIYHLGSALAVLGLAVSAADFVVCKEDGGTYSIPTTMWNVLVGLSGDRKSAAMRGGMKLLERAMRQKGLGSAQLPADGSQEAWHDLMAGDPDADPPEAPRNGLMLFRDELAFLFDQSRRGYGEGLKSWLMMLHGGDPLSRLTKGTKTARTINRPRLGILGAIPPDTFRSKTGRSDWRSGFLARMTFWPGVRTRFMPVPGSDYGIETTLSEWLHNVPLTMAPARIVLDAENTHPVTEWILANVEGPRFEMPDDIVSHLIRYQDMAYRIAALSAVSELDYAPTEVHVEQRHVDLALRYCSIMKRAVKQLWELTRLSDEGREEAEVLARLEQEYPGRMSIEELGAELPHLSVSRLRRMLGDLMEAGIVRSVVSDRGGDRGRRKNLYFKV